MTVKMKSTKRHAWVYVVWLSVVLGVFIIIAWKPLIKMCKLIYTFITTSDF
jgi:hypothetical protein